MSIISYRRYSATPACDGRDTSRLSKSIQVQLASPLNCQQHAKFYLFLNYSGVHGKLFSVVRFIVQANYWRQSRHRSEIRGWDYSAHSWSFSVLRLPRERLFQVRYSNVYVMYARGTQTASSSVSEAIKRRAKFVKFSAVRGPKLVCRLITSSV